MWHRLIGIKERKDPTLLENQGAERLISTKASVKVRCMPVSVGLLCNLYLMHTKKAMAILQKDTHHSIHIRRYVTSSSLSFSLSHPTSSNHLKIQGKPP